jgi:endonuclease/exonuclease/phosphatase family metal-dependent hydrolase
MGRLRVVTWNQDHWKRTPAQREAGWARLDAMRVDVALLQESVPPHGIGRERVLWREIGGSRRWGSSVLTFGMKLEEITHARTRYARHAYALQQTYPGAIAIGRVHPPAGLPVTVISVYGVMDPYVQTTLFRMVADLIPLFDSVDGRRVILGGDLNLETASQSPERPRLLAILASIESLGLVNLFRVAKERPPRAPNCPCAMGTDCFHVQTHRHDSFVGTDRQDFPSHLDYLFASPELAADCSRVWLDEGDADWALSDHRAVLADFDLSERTDRVRSWDERTFVDQIERMHGTEAAIAVINALDWAEKQNLRIAFEDGVEGQWWAQLDGPDDLQWTFSMRTEGDVVIHFQRMRGPFADADAKDALRRRLNAIPGVAIPAERLSGRPTIPLSALRAPSQLQAFLDVFDDAVKQTRAFWNASRPSSSSSS